MIPSETLLTERTRLVEHSRPARLAASVRFGREFPERVPMRTKKIVSVAAKGSRPTKGKF